MIADATPAGVGPVDGERLFAELVQAAARRYFGTTVTAWQFARGKLRGDRVYRSALYDQALPSGGTLLDVGCGQGLAIALFLEAGRRYSRGAWPASLTPPPRFDRLIGIELRPRVARIARRALGRDAEIAASDARREAFGRARVALLFDVLQMMPEADQDALLAHLARSLEPDGVLLVREADASGGWGFRVVHAANQAKAIAFGAWRQRFHFRSRDAWLAVFARLGLRATAQPMGEGTPFANILFRVTR
jgi:SAM-dependent methyltransferase